VIKLNSSIVNKISKVGTIHQGKTLRYLKAEPLESSNSRDLIYNSSVQNDDEQKHGKNNINEIGPNEKSNPLNNGLQQNKNCEDEEDNICKICFRYIDK
jgi:hypothetical protein